MTPDVSFVITSYNGRDLLERCLNSIWKQTRTDYEVIVVDNASDDSSVEDLVRSMARPELRLVSLPPPNRGATPGCNAGLSQARGRYVVNLNNDIELEPRWLEEMVRCLDSHPEAGMCASKLLFHADRRRIDKTGHLMYWDGLNHGRGSGEIDRGQFEEPVEVLLPDGAAAIYRKEMLDVTGLYDEIFGGYGDDADLGLRGQLVGWRCRYVPGAVAYHVHSATHGRFSTNKAFHIERNRVWVAIKTFPLILLLVSPAFTLLRYMFHAIGVLFLIGSSGDFARSSSRARLAAAMVHANLSALAGLPEMWRRRRQIMRFRKTGTLTFLRLLWRHRISLPALTLGT